MLRSNRLLLLLPFDTERRISKHVIKFLFLESVLLKNITQSNVVGFFILDDHVGLANCECFVVPVLSIKNRIGLSIQRSYILLRYRKHTSSPTSRVIDHFDNVTASKILFRRQE